VRGALVLSLVVAVGLGFAAFAQGELTGSWDATITIHPEEAALGDFFDFTSALTVTYSVGGWGFTSYFKVDDAGFSDVYFTAGGSFGAFTIDSKLVLSTAGGFSSWAVDTSFTFGSADFGIGLDLVSNDLTLTLTTAATTGLVDLDTTIRFGQSGGGCDLGWRGIDATVGFPFHCAGVTATLAVDCAGFRSLSLEVDGIALSNIPWFRLGAKLRFELESKTLVLTPAFAFGADVCFSVYACSDSDGGKGPLTALQILDIYVAGIGLTCEVGGVSFTGISFWGDGCASLKPSTLGSHWEMYRIATTEGACCGSFDFDVAVFFDVASTYLSDIAAFEASFSYDLGDAFALTLGLDYTAASGLTEWTIGFDITW
jgi:hypothetical protein